jgi:hypothetical protein
VTDKQFFLFPTYLHQAPEGVVPKWRDAVIASKDPAPGRVWIGHYASVSSWLRIRTLEKLNALRGLHIWSDEVVKERFQRWADDGVFALVVRIYALPKPVSLPLLPAYDGCKSWLTLAEQVPLEDARPVVDDAEFERRRAEVSAVVG